MKTFPRFGAPLLALFLLTSCGSEGSVGSPDGNALSPSGNVESGPTGVPPSVLGTFRDTYYYVIMEQNYANQAKNTDVQDVQGHVLATVAKNFKKAMDIEGTGRLMDGRVLNYAGLVNGKIRYYVSPSPYGDGVGHCQLVPFRSVAMDPNRIPLGSVILIDETVGMRLPDGTIHDGYWTVHDVGGAIHGDRIDLFVGDGDQGYILDRQGIGHLQPLTIRLVNTPVGTDNCAR